MSIFENGDEGESNVLEDLTAENRKMMYVYKIDKLIFSQPKNQSISNAVQGSDGDGVGIYPRLFDERYSYQDFKIDDNLD